MKKVFVSVFRDSWLNCDCTNNGVTSRHNRMMLFWDCERDEAVKYCVENGIDVDSALYLEYRELWGEDHSCATPLIIPKGKVGPMMGGNFIYTSDSRLYKIGERKCAVPIPVHDRFETPEQYRALSI